MAGASGPNTLPPRSPLPRPLHRWHADRNLSDVTFRAIAHSRPQRLLSRGHARTRKLLAAMKFTRR